MNSTKHVWQGPQEGLEIEPLAFAIDEVSYGEGLPPRFLVRTKLGWLAGRAHIEDRI